MPVHCIPVNRRRRLSRLQPSSLLLRLQCTDLMQIMLLHAVQHQQTTLLLLPLATTTRPSCQDNEDDSCSMMLWRNPWCMFYPCGMHVHG